MQFAHVFIHQTSCQGGAHFTNANRFYWTVVVMSDIRVFPEYPYIFWPNALKIGLGMFVQ